MSPPPAPHPARPLETKQAACQKPSTRSRRVRVIRAEEVYRGPDGALAEYQRFVQRQLRGGAPWVRFDNAHRVKERGRGHRLKRIAYDHHHRTSKDRGRPYQFSTAMALLDDFWREVKRVLNEKGIPNDL